MQKLHFRAERRSGALEAGGKQRFGVLAGRDIDLRREERIEVRLPVVFESGKAGTTLNVSATGVLLETHDVVRLGMPVTMIIEFSNHLGGPLRVTCEASVLRVEEVNGLRRIAAALRWIAQS